MGVKRIRRFGKYFWGNFIDGKLESMKRYHPDTKDSVRAKIKASKTLMEGFRLTTASNWKTYLYEANISFKETPKNMTSRLWGYQIQASTRFKNRIYYGFSKYYGNKYNINEAKQEAYYNLGRTIAGMYYGNSDEEVVINPDNIQFTLKTFKNK